MRREQRGCHRQRVQQHPAHAFEAAAQAVGKGDAGHEIGGQSPQGENVSMNTTPSSRPVNTSQIIWRPRKRPIRVMVCMEVIS